MATPLEIQQAAVAAIKTALPQLATCAAYAGEFSGGDLQRASVQSPAVLVACLSCTRSGDVDCGDVDWLCRYTAYCMARSSANRLDRADSALALAWSVVPALDGLRFGLTGVLPAKVTRVDNLYAENWDKASVALWAVTWEQKARIFAASDPSDEGGKTPEEIYLGQAPEIGAAHEDDYELVNKLEGV